MLHCLHTVFPLTLLFDHCMGLERHCCCWSFIIVFQQFWTLALKFGAPNERTDVEGWLKDHGKIQCIAFVRRILSFSLMPGQPMLPKVAIWKAWGKPLRHSDLTEELHFHTSGGQIKQEGCHSEHQQEIMAGQRWPK